VKDGRRRDARPTAAQALERYGPEIPVVTYGMGGQVTFNMKRRVVDLIPVRAAHNGGEP